MDISLIGRNTWSGLATVETMPAIVQRFRTTLVGTPFSAVTTNVALPHATPKVHAGIRIEDPGPWTDHAPEAVRFDVRVADDGREWGSMSWSAGHYSWGLSTWVHDADQVTELTRSNFYIVFEGTTIEVRQLNGLKEELIWVFKPSEEE